MLCVDINVDKHCVDHSLNSYHQNIEMKLKKCIMGRSGYHLLYNY